MTPQVQMLVKEITQRLPVHKSVPAAADDLLSFFKSMGGVSAEIEASLEEAIKVVEASQQSVEILRRNSLVKIKDHWYKGPLLTDRHWTALEGYLRNAKNWHDESIDPIHDSSSEVVSLLANPARETFRCRGLVVGYVQSGKTANMTAVIAKAIDVGYNFIVVLGGVTNKLRQQTQRRFQTDIIDRHRESWQLHTTDDEKNGDFTLPANNGQFTMPVEGRAQLAVIKKETTRLATLLKAIEKTPPSVTRALKTLIIDDECDQASVNAGKTETDITEINKAIRKIIQALPAVSYVGYTATPFANVFANPFPTSKDELDDLYPEDFITALPRPEAYFGAREVFGFDPDDADIDEGASAGREMVKPIPEKEIPLLRSTKNRKDFSPQITESLEKAILWFLLSCAIRHHRGQQNDHMSMLVHTSQLVLQHEKMADNIRQWLEYSAPSIASAKGPAWDALVSVWDDETKAVPLEGEDEKALHPLDLHPFLVQVLNLVEVAVENGASDNRLDYNETDPEDKNKIVPKTYIVVGGSVLARGLTLEGLSVSFFLRTSKQYDTLLQMGRWFGFRNGYADLPRLWATQDLISNFRALAHIEEEIRADIAQYKARDATPLDFAVKVRAIPGLAITSAAKMRYAKKTSISFEGRHIQTIRFDHQKDGIVSSNWAAAANLIKLAKDSASEYVEDKKLFKNVPMSVVRQFIKDYDISGKHLDLKQEMLLNYLDATEDKLAIWNVGVVSPNGKPSNNSLGFLGKIGTNVRSRLAEPSAYADIKALMSKRDILIDADLQSIDKGEDWEALKKRRPNLPLLLIYPIQAKSEPLERKDGAKSRVALDACDDLIGFSIVFPGMKDRAGAYYAVELDVPTPEQLEEDEELEEPDAEAN
ncbi:MULTISPECIES: Z1 domain-containing protein [unclassified Herbaspirillum]|uniref:Z1 domain-containing protein n=1 Tax=unclassified Herbaspirillum TaxID=2624150 RepID=UPI000E2E438F|nr:MULTISPECIES: Z1 domain-containing protein [unclassified Herbaspirillum]RFB67377.1 endonuclease [Herbaspirillum sp. 3R-3a1]TFI04983.1 endonuclease [Herbaspirillum sp. 3R11]TFI12686.1 endonuclease [Herbaspirillum sp. 3R-11]TFI27951.1 endonuclease [Herbaspirillum sp. 3C11]